MIDRLTGDRFEESTEWEDIHRRHGNFVSKPKRLPSDILHKNHLEQVEKERERLQLLSKTNLEQQLLQQEQDLELAADLDPDLHKIRQSRIAEMKQQMSFKKFGKVIKIRKIDFIKEVNEASSEPILANNNIRRVLSNGINLNDNIKVQNQNSDQKYYKDNSTTTSNKYLSDTDDNDDVKMSSSTKFNENTTSFADYIALKCAEQFPESIPCLWVIVYLYQETSQSCQLLQNIIEQLASKYQSIKFVSGVSNEIIPGFPDRGVPSLFLYNRGKCQKQLFLQQEIFQSELYQKEIRFYSESMKNYKKVKRNFLFRTLEYLLYSNSVLESTVIPSIENSWEESRVSTILRPTRKNSNSSKKPNCNIIVWSGTETNVGVVQTIDPRLSYQNIYQYESESENENSDLEDYRGYTGHDSGNVSKVNFKSDRGYTGYIR